jgi:hypothetical protein
MIKQTFPKRRTADLRPFCHLATGEALVEVTEWTNGEGVDIIIQRESQSHERFSLTHGELEAVYLVAKMPS